jgi:hypothetical protein
MITGRYTHRPGAGPEPGAPGGTPAPTPEGDRPWPLSLRRRTLLLAAPALLLSGQGVRPLPPDGGRARCWKRRHRLTTRRRSSWRATRWRPNTRGRHPPAHAPERHPRGPGRGLPRPRRGRFRTGRLTVTGLVERPPGPVARRDLRAMPARTQITRHDCVEGWSCIAEWTGVAAVPVLDLARPRRGAVPVLPLMTRPSGGSRGRSSTGSPWTSATRSTPDDPGLGDERGGACRWRTGRPCGCGWSGSSATRWPSTHAIAVVPRSRIRGLLEERGYDWYAGI